jgi:hypothetical protein
LLIEVIIATLAWQKPLAAFLGSGGGAFSMSDVSAKLSA